MTPLASYVSRVIALAAVGAFPPGSVTIAQAVHDDACRRPEGGPCTCVPDLTLTEVGPDGHPRGGPRAS